MSRFYFVLILCLCGFASPLAAEPRLPAFERFFSQDTTRDRDAGAYLLGELSCVKCHQVEKSIRISSRTAPILDNVGSRVQIDHLRKFLTDPHQAKPGTLMPNLFSGLSDEHRRERIEPLVHFLASTGTLHEVGPNTAAIKKGDRLYHTLGCVACHGSRKPDAKELATSVPLGNLAEKYSIPSLAAFLKEPHKVRPSGRMPSLNLKDDEARELANYFLRDVAVPANIAYDVYEGSWNKLPDFETMKPKTTGTCTGFDLGVAGKTNNFAIRFSGFLQIEQAGQYEFELGSDDGSRLLINGLPYVDVDGVHPHQTERSRKNVFEVGVYPVLVEYFQGGGEWTLEANYQGPGIPKQPLANAITLTREKPVAGPDGFQLDPALVVQGRDLFGSIGCANCHQLKENDTTIVSTLKAKSLKDLPVEPALGCLSPAAKSPAVNYSLSLRQSQMIGVALTDLDALTTPTGEAAVFQTMATFNCYACHDRNEIGGVEREREGLFQTTIPEMGDEGRIPPSLTGVGDKLNDDWLKHILNSGAQDRPYMLTRMPRFGANHVKTLLTEFPQLDRKELTARADFEQPIYRVKAEGRMMVGDKELSCVKCHPFGNSQATGIQALNLQSMTNRLREDWFNRYMINPQEYRRGTRMPSAWPNGRTILRDVLDGHTQKQLSAIWLYLEDRDKAAIPLGLGGQTIVLEPTDRPIIYRNFIEGLSPRGIAVGYPEEAHLAFDAEQFGIRLIWHGAFIDAAKHWGGRGQGNQIPLGDHLVKLVQGIPFAKLDSLDKSWPTGNPRETGYKFKGYTLNDKGQPTFRFEFDGLEVTDFPQPIKGDRDASFKRTITVKSHDSPPSNLYLRVARGKLEKQSDGLFVQDGILKLRVPADALLRDSAGEQELLVPITFEANRASFEVDYLW